MKLTVRPVSRKEVRAFIARHHSHHHKPSMWMLAVGVNEGDRLCCVGTLNQPLARLLCDGYTTEISRVASDGTRHAASMCIAALTRAAVAIGYLRLVSYTLLGEHGTSYRASGWVPTAISGGGSWSRPSRPEPERISVQLGTKVRWEYGPRALPLCEKTDALVRDQAGKVELAHKSDFMPLFDAANRTKGAA